MKVLIYAYLWVFLFNFLVKHVVVHLESLS